MLCGARFDYPTLKARAIALAEEHKANRILIEDTGVGPALIAELRKAGLPVVAISQSKTNAPVCPSNRASLKAVRCYSRTGRDGWPTLKPSFFRVSKLTPR